MTTKAGKQRCVISVVRGITSLVRRRSKLHNGRVVVLSEVNRMQEVHMLVDGGLLNTWWRFLPALTIMAYCLRRNAKH